MQEHVNSSYGGDEAPWFKSQVDISNLISLYKLDYEDHVNLPLYPDHLAMATYGGKFLDAEGTLL